MTESSQKQLNVGLIDATGHFLSPECPQAVPSDPGTSGILVHSALPVEPCSSLDDAPLVDSLRWVNSSFV